MEKDFKEEYSKHLKSETPDLWDRIESGLTEKTPASKVSKFPGKKWMAAVPAAAAVVLLIVAAPIFMPKGSTGSAEKAALDLAFFDTTADNAAPEAGFYAEEEVAPEETEHVRVKEETDVEIAADRNTDDNFAYGADQGTQTATGGNAGGTQEQELKKEKTETKVLHLQVEEHLSTDDLYLLAVDIEPIQQVYELYLVLVEGEEKRLAVPIDSEMKFETGIWYDLEVTDAQESGIDYIWVE